MSLRSLYLILCLLLASKLLAQQSRIDSLEAIIAKNNRDLETIKTLNLVSIEWNRKDVNKAKSHLWKAKSLLKTIPDDGSLSSTYSQLVGIYKHSAQIDSAEIYLSALKTLSEKPTNKNDVKVQTNYALTAGLYYKKSGKYKEALVYYNKAYELSKSVGDIASTSGQAINIGNCYLSMSNYNEGLKYYLLALEGFEKIDNKTGLSFCYNNIANCYTELKRYNEALPYINKSIKLKTELGDKRGIANAEQNLGSVYFGLNNFDKALMHYKKALSLNEEMNLKTEIAGNYHSIGKLYSEKGEKLKALEFFEKSKNLALKIEDSTQVISADLEILALNKLNEEPILTENNALTSLKALHTSGVKSQVAEGYKSMAAYYTNLKQFDKALEYTNLYYTLIDSIKNNEIQTQFKSIEEQYNKVNNEKQIELLQKDQLLTDEKLKKQQSLLILSGAIILFISLGIWMLINRNKLRQKMKEVELRNQIAADLHDEVGSSLSSIFMLSKMAVNASETNQQTILSKVSDNAHETMDKMSDIVWMLKPSESYGVGLKERMEQFIQDLCHSRGIQYSFITNNLEKTKLTPTQSKNLYLIVKEGVNNAVKYAHTKTLQVEINIADKKLQLLIEDQGIGFDSETIEMGNGLTNMRNRAIELNGTLKIDSEPQKGTRIHLSFPVS